MHPTCLYSTGRKGSQMQRSSRPAQPRDGCCCGTHIADICLHASMHGVSHVTCPTRDCLDSSLVVPATQQMVWLDPCSGVSCSSCNLGPHHEVRPLAVVKLPPSSVGDRRAMSRMWTVSGYWLGCLTFSVTRLICDHHHALCGDMPDYEA